jgi:hypothetical protein
VNSSGLEGLAEDWNKPTIELVINYTNTMTAHLLADLMVETSPVGQPMRDPVQSVKLLPTYRSL